MAAISAHFLGRTPNIEALDELQFAGINQQLVLTEQCDVKLLVEIANRIREITKASLFLYLTGFGVEDCKPAVDVITAAVFSSHVSDGEMLRVDSREAASESCHGVFPHDFKPATQAEDLLIESTADIEITIETDDSAGKERIESESLDHLTRFYVDYRNFLALLVIVTGVEHDQPSRKRDGLVWQSSDGHRRAGRSNSPAIRQFNF